MVETTRSLEDIDFLLRRNWFIDREDIIDLLYLASEEDWEWIVKNRDRYHVDIQDMIHREAKLPSVTSSLRIRDISDSEYNQIVFETEKQATLNAENRWKEYKRIHSIEPPRSYYHEQLDTLNAQYEKECKEYARYGANKDVILTRIQTIKNEIEKVGDKITQHNKDWEFLAKAEFRIHGALSKLSQEESYCSNV